MASPPTARQKAVTTTIRLMFFMFQVAVDFVSPPWQPTLPGQVADRLGSAWKICSLSETTESNPEMSTQYCAMNRMRATPSANERGDKTDGDQRFHRLDTGLAEVGSSSFKDQSYSI